MASNTYYSPEQIRQILNRRWVTGSTVSGVFGRRNTRGKKLVSMYGGARGLLTGALVAKGKNAMIDFLPDSKEIIEMLDDIFSSDSATLKSIGLNKKARIAAARRWQGALTMCEEREKKLQKWVVMTYRDITKRANTPRLTDNLRLGGVRPLVDDFPLKVDVVVDSDELLKNAGKSLPTVRKYVKRWTYKYTYSKNPHRSWKDGIKHAPGERVEEKREKAYPAGKYMVKISDFDYSGWKEWEDSMGSDIKLANSDNITVGYDFIGTVWEKIKNSNAKKVGL